MLRAYGMKDVGRCRDTNQDYIFISEKPVGNLPNLFLVADGMGGHKAGDLASEYTVSRVYSLPGSGGSRKKYAEYPSTDF